MPSAMPKEETSRAALDRPTSGALPARTFEMCCSIAPAWLPPMPNALWPRKPQTVLGALHRPVHDGFGCALRVCGRFPLGSGMCRVTLDRSIFAAAPSRQPCCYMLITTGSALPSCMGSSVAARRNSAQRSNLSIPIARAMRSRSGYASKTAAFSAGISSAADRYPRIDPIEPLDLVANAGVPSLSPQQAAAKNLPKRFKRR